MSSLVTYIEGEGGQGEPPGRQLLEVGQALQAVLGVVTCSLSPPLTLLPAVRVLWT